MLTRLNLEDCMYFQAFILPFTESATMSRVVKVYQEWIQVSASAPNFFINFLQHKLGNLFFLSAQQDSNVPVFMEDPDLNVTDNRLNEDETLEVSQLPYMFFIFILQILR